jgi:hypothetical protein
MRFNLRTTNKRRKLTANQLENGNTHFKRDVNFAKSDTSIGRRFECWRIYNILFKSLSLPVEEVDTQSCTGQQKRAALNPDPCIPQFKPYTLNPEL